MRLSAMQSATLAGVLISAFLSILPACASNFDAAWGSSAWVDAGATYFGRDQWSLNIGSCGYGFVCPNRCMPDPYKGLCLCQISHFFPIRVQSWIDDCRWSNELASGYDVVAVSDQSPLYSGSHTGAQCGRCLEIKCRDGSVADSSGSRYARQSLCKKAGATVKVKVTDTCDCNYPKNAASNARWCCGGSPHLDVSQWALSKLVEDTTRWGVFAISYRPVSCEGAISNQAAAIPIVKSPHDGDKPKSLNCNTQSRGSDGSSSQRRGR